MRMETARQVAAHPATVAIELAGTGVARPQAAPTNVITKAKGPSIGLVGPWRVQLPGHGWAAFDVALEQRDAARMP